jgi:hypothetical protein
MSGAEATDTQPKAEHDAPATQVIAADDARAMLAQERDRRARAFAAGLKALMEQYRVRLDWVEVRRNGQVVQAELKVVALD